MRQYGHTKLQIQCSLFLQNKTKQQVFHRITQWGVFCILSSMSIQQNLINFEWTEGKSRYRKTNPLQNTFHAKPALLKVKHHKLKTNNLKFPLCSLNKTITFPFRSVNGNFNSTCVRGISIPVSKWTYIYKTLKVSNNYQVISKH